MKIGIDISDLHEASRNRGIGFYAKYLINSLEKYTDEKVVVIEKKGFDVKIDILHYPFFDLFRATLPLVKEVPTVVTIHDVIPLVFPEQYPPGIRGRIALERQKLALRNVKAIITDSKASKIDIIKYLKVKEERVYPIYLAPAEHFRIIEDESKLIGVRKKYDLPKKFGLYVGNVNWNKNLINLTQACIDINLDLVLVGGGFSIENNLNHPELKTLKQFREKYSSHKLIHVVNFVDDSDLVIIYNLAQILLMPSFYEGFGLPVLEAQKCGCPVITSNVSSLPEVVGKSAILIDPEKMEQIKDAVKQVLNDKMLREKLIKRGLENVKKFTWQRCAKETVKVYEYVLKKI